MAREYFAPLLEPRHLNALIESISSACEPMGPLGKRFLEQENFLALCLRARTALQERVAAVSVCAFGAVSVHGVGA